MNRFLAAAIVAAGAFAPASAFAYTAEQLCPQWSQRGPIITAVCFNGRKYDLVPARIDLRTCEPGADVANLYGVLVCMNPQRPRYVSPDYDYDDAPPPPPRWGYGYHRHDEWRRRPHGPNWD